VAVALGIDVGAHRHDAVLLDGTVVTDLGDLRAPDELGRLLERHRPGVIAIDAPPRFAPDGVAYRAAERRLRSHGIQAFYVPPPSRGGGAFYDWMRAGFDLFEVASACGYPLACRVEDAAGGAIEAFPHGAAVALADRLPPRGLRGAARRRWRQTVLAEQGVAGLVVFAAVFGLALRDTIALRRSSQGWIGVLGSGLLASLLGFALHNQFDVTLVEGTGTYFWAVLGLLSALTAVERREATARGTGTGRGSADEPTSSPSPTHLS